VARTAIGSPAGRHRCVGSRRLSSLGPEAEAARAEFRAILAEKGHSVDIARRAVARLERAFADGALRETPLIRQALTDLRVALAQDEGEKLGGKSAEAARFILRAIDRELDSA
jgi:hypothetical protein